MDNYPDNYKISACEKCCEYNDREQKEIKRLRKIINLMLERDCNTCLAYKKCEAINLNMCLDHIVKYYSL